jgi:hypothetical protein
MKIHFFILRCNFLELRVSFNLIFKHPVECSKEEEEKKRREFAIKKLTEENRERFD